MKKEIKYDSEKIRKVRETLFNSRDFYFKNGAGDVLEDYAICDCNGMVRIDFRKNTATIHGKDNLDEKTLELLESLK